MFTRFGSSELHVSAPRAHECSDDVIVGMQVSYSEEGTAAEADTLAAQAEHASTDPTDVGEQASEEAASQ